jgi:1-acyl-sn-glycerol-3-phosphate acyltransferase
MPAEPRAIEQHAADPGLLAWLRSPWQTLILAIGLAYWAAGGVLFSVIGWILFPLLPRRTGRRVGNKMIRGGFGLFVSFLGWTRIIHVDLSSLKKLEDTDKSFIIAPNHTSLWDVVFLITCLPRPLCVMKKSILYNPVLGGSALLAGHIPNSSKSGMIRGAARALDRGGQLILFPEGTRTKQHERWINPLKGGVALISRKAGVPVYPVFIRSNTRYMEKGWPPWRKPDFPIHMSFELGDPIQPERDESAQDFTARLHQLFEHELSRPHPLRRQSVEG